MNKIYFLFIAIFFSASGFSQVKFDNYILGNIEARQIGPAVMSGRITAIDAVAKDPAVIYVGSASGGLWKSISGGTYFKPVFDKYCQSIGSIAIDQKNPNIVYAGTGESNMRNSVSVGNGIYKTSDAGITWNFIGLENSEHISKILIDPKNSDIIYVAVPGALWCDGKDRGLYKSVNGGLNWENILYVDEKTGCADIIIDPVNPEIIYASMWQFRRTPYSFNSGGQGSGLYKSPDAGLTWQRIDKDFTTGELGRICLAISYSEPSHIYAIAESKNTALYSSTDGGNNWKKNSTTMNVTARPFYFSSIVVDPKDSKRIYRPAFSLSISNDGGESFFESQSEQGWVHSDFHTLWINPENPNQIYLGTDGGVYMSLNRGVDWTFLANLPVAQFYHVSTDNARPYNVYGGLQDNGAWFGPSDNNIGIKNRDWINVGGGDGFCTFADKEFNYIVYSESQGGELYRINRNTGITKDVQPQQTKNDPKLRFNWNTPVYLNGKNEIFIGSQFLYKSTNRGDDWEKISPDLTTNDTSKLNQENSGGLSIENTSAENYCTIYSIAQSQLNPDILWIGTDDGNLQISKNGGTSWSNVINNIPELPKNTWCSSIEPSHFDSRTAYITFDGHRTGDKNAYVFKTTDFGKTWKSIKQDIIKSYVHKIIEDVVNKELIFLGTESGLFISTNGGNDWIHFTNYLPEVPVMDMTIEKNSNDLVLATHGRGIIIIDDITPIRFLSAKILNSDFCFLPHREYFLGGSYNYSFWAFPPNSGEYVGATSSDDFPFYYYLKDRLVSGDIKLEIYDNKNNLINTLPGTKRKGINIVRWNMKMKPPKVATGSKIEYNALSGPLVDEGEYKLKVIAGEKVYTEKFNLKYRPDYPYSTEERDSKRNAVMKLYHMQEELADISENLKKRNEEIKLKINNAEGVQADKLSEYSKEIDSLLTTIAATKEGGYILGETKLREDIGSLFGSINSFPGKPTNLQVERISKLESDLNRVKKKSSLLLNMKY